MILDELGGELEDFDKEIGTDSDIDWNLWKNGGTLVSNYGIHQKEELQQAIQKVGRDDLKVRSEGMNDTVCSLHCFSRCGSVDLSAFWKALDDIRKEKDEMEEEEE